MEYIVTINAEINNNSVQIPIYHKNDKTSNSAVVGLLPPWLEFAG